MATVLEVITEALVTVKAHAVGETVPAEMANDALNKFNEVLEALSIQNLAVYTNLITTFPLVAGTASYTIGPTGTVVAQRPPFLTTGFATLNGIDFPVDCTKTSDEYAALALKTNPGIPEWGVYDQAFPDGVLVLWPVPSQAMTMTVYQNQEFTAATSLADTFTQPPGYRKMIRLMLAWELASDYPGLSVAELNKLDADTKQAIALVKRNTKKPELLSSEVAQLDCSGGGNSGNWRSGA